MQSTYGIFEGDRLTPSLLEKKNGQPRLNSWLSNALTSIIVLAVVIPPFLFGGREAIGQSVLAGLVLAGCGLAVLRYIICNYQLPSLWRMEVLIPAAAVALYVLTWVPVGPRIVHAISPGTTRLLHGLNGSMLDMPHYKGWSTFSLAPGLSRDATFIVLLHALLFWLTLFSIRTADAVRRILGVFLLCGVGVALVGLLHYVFWNGKFYGLWSLWWVRPDNLMRAPFTNRNHFAGFLALTLGPGITYLSWLVRRRFGGAPALTFAERGVRQLSGGFNSRSSELLVFGTVVGLIVILASIFLSQSRGGAVAAFVAVAFAILGTLACSKSRAKGAVVCGFVALAALAIVFAFGGPRVLERVYGMLGVGRSLDELSTHRIMLWKADLQAVGDFPFLGGGPGAHVYLYPLYLKEQHPTTFTHAENCYLQVLVECGFLGTGVLAGAILCGGWWSFRKLPVVGQTAVTEASACSIGIAASLLAALVQGFVDFVWYVPAYAAAVSVLAALACRLYQLRVSVDKRSPLLTRPRLNPSNLGRWVWGCSLTGAWVFMAVVIAGHFMNLVRIEFAWNAYYRLLPSEEKVANTPPPNRVNEQWHCLTTACRLGTADPDHHYRLGLLNQERSLNQSRSAQDRLTLIELELSLKEQQITSPPVAAAWIDDTFGCDWKLLEQSRNHFREAVRCCPLLGLTYLRLAELSFLKNPANPDPVPFRRQALLVRPNDPLVWLQVGTQHCAEGDLKAAGQYWRRACEIAPACEWQLLPVLGPVLAPSEIVNLIPVDFGGLEWLARQPIAHEQVAETQFLARHARQLVEADTVQCREPAAWNSLHHFFVGAQLPEEAERCLKRTVILTPSQFTYRVHLAHWLLEHGKREESLEHLQQLRKTFPTQPEVLSLETALFKDRR